MRRSVSMLVAALVLPVPEVVVSGQVFEKGNNPVLRTSFNLADFTYGTADYEIGTIRARERSRSSTIFSGVFISNMVMHDNIDYVTVQKCVIIWEMTVAERVVAYVHENLGEEPIVTAWQDDGSLPLYLREPYEYRLSTIHGRDVLLMIVRATDPPSPGVVAKQCGIIRDRTGLEPVVIFSSLSSYNRKRLVERGVSFIVPGNQMYLSPLGIDFRQYRRRSAPEVHTVQPATQRTIIALLSPDLREGEYSQSDLAEKLGYSTMTLSRVFTELEAISFGNQLTAGRKRLLRLSGNDRYALWNHVLPYLSTPVKRTETILILKEPDAGLPLSGISALAQQSDLAEPRRETVAAGENQWRRMYRLGSVQVVPPTEETATLVEVWKHPPQRWGETVDPLSLYLSLRESPDERIQGALEFLLERFPW